MGTLTIPPYRAALLTGADGTPMVRAAGPDSKQIQTELQWYMFWQDVARQINAGSEAIDSLEGLVTFGNHLDRPDGRFQHDGALYVEVDRGSVLYQNQGGVWQYIAGIMYGTLVPDQRPADLGPAADAGFQFRTTTDPARAFTWNGGEWVETTPIRYGTHAERLAAPIADLVSGMLWMETDRGSVIYQNQGGTWLFLNGTMWDTMSPDNRPTDLGVHDAGFLYRSTDAPAREFVWNQVAWVETTPLLDPTTTKGDLIARGSTAPATRFPVGSNGQVLTADSTQTLGVRWGTPAGGGLQWVNASSPLTLTTTMTDVPGLTLTLPKAGIYQISGVIDFAANDSQALLLGQLVVNGSAHGTLVIYQAFSVPSRATVAQVWMLTTGSPGVVVKIQANKNLGAGGSLAHVHSTLSAAFLSP